MDKENAKRVSDENFQKIHNEYTRIEYALGKMETIIGLMQDTIDGFKKSVEDVNKSNQKSYADIQERLKDGKEEDGYFPYFIGSDIWRTSDRNFFIHSMKVKSEEVKRLVKEIQRIRPWN